MKPFFTFFGGKWRSAPHYPAPAHDRIVEPFAGAAGYSVRHHARDVVLVERDPTIAALWRYLISAKPADILALPDVEAGQSVDDLDVCPAAGSLIGFWLNKGTAAPCKRPSAWMRSGIRPDSFWGPTIRARIAAQVCAISHWTVIEGDYTEAPAGAATWFIDPPYQGAGSNYRCSSRTIDFTALGRWCVGRAGQVIACENAGAGWLPFRPLMASKATHGRHRSGVSREAVWIGGEVEAPAIGLAA